LIKYIVIVVAGTLFSFVVTPAIRALAFRIGAVDIPGGRRINTVPTPRLGGIAVFGAMLFSLGLGWAVDPFIRRAVAAHPWQLGALGAAATCLVVVGAIDDRRSVKATTKLLVEIAAAALVVSAGYRIHTLLGVEIGWLSAVATVFWIVAVTNAINMVDGLDGLAAGLGLIISASLFSIAVFLGSLTTAAILAALCGALLGFLCHNFHPARIFLGDSGSLLVGFLLAVTAIESSNKAATVAAILFPLLSLGLPLSEIVLTTLRRILRGIRVVRLDAGTQRYEFSVFGGPALFTADREHIHHRLLAMGITHRNVVVALYGVCALLGTCSFLIVVYRVTSLGLLLLSFGIVAIAARRLGYRELQPLSNGLFLPLFNLPGMSRSVVYILCDLGFIAISYVGAWLIRSEFDLSRATMLPLLNALPLLATVQIGGFTLAGLYRRSYRYAGIADLLAMGRAIAFAVVGGWIVLVVARHWERPALSLIVLDGYLLATLVLGSRLSFRLLDYLFNANRRGMQRALIYGAGNGGAAALREMWFNPSLGMRPVGFLDDDAHKRGRMLQGILIHGTEELEDLINGRKMDAVVVATGKIPQDRLKRIMQRCSVAGIPMRIFHIGLDEIERQPKVILRAEAAQRSQA
jgi:UDP-GlcNAc:undecaprenyl-phosphate/decaprenyl-phosphate GlcNAc-1-phosphate transferase